MLLTVVVAGGRVRERERRGEGRVQQAAARRGYRGRARPAARAGYGHGRAQQAAVSHGAGRRGQVKGRRSRSRSRSDPDVGCHLILEQEERSLRNGHSLHTKAPGGPSVLCIALRIKGMRLKELNSIPPRTLAVPLPHQGSYRGTDRVRFRNRNQVSELEAFVLPKTYGWKFEDGHTCVTSYSYNENDEGK